MYKKLSLFLFLTTSILNANNLKTLLDGYQQESQLSNITKRDSAGFLELFTRSDLEKMQAHSLMDVLQAIPGLYLQRAANNLASAAIPSNANLPLTYTRLYINDHDVTSSIYGNASLIWGEMPIDDIDHIEVYESTSSLEFGGENAAIIIRLYTKKASRENGSKLRVGVDDLGSVDSSFYTAKLLNNNLSYFAFANINNIKRTLYNHTYNNHNYNYNSNRESYNVYGNIGYKNWHFELNVYKKNNGDFMGIGTHKTPTGGGLHAKHAYLNITKKFQNHLKLQLSYDRVNYDRTYSDPNGIRVANAPLLNHYATNVTDNNYALSITKKFTMQNNTLLLGSFYKHKTFHADGDYTNNLRYRHTNSGSNVLSLSSIYGENKYNVTQNFQVVGSLKEDFFRYEKEVKSDNEFLARAGFIYKYNKYKFKAFYTKGYVPLALYQVYNPDNIPYKANPQLNTMKTGIYTTAVEYKANQQDISLEIAQMRARDLIYKTPTDEWKNSSAKYVETIYQLNYTYKFNLDNKISSSFVYGRANNGTITSSPFNALVKSFNTYKKFDFYNALNYKTAYTSRYGADMKSSVGFTSALKYHYSENLSFGIKGENIFNDGAKESYQGTNSTIAIVDQKVWANMEYLF